MPKDTLHYFSILKSNTCHCGRFKPAKWPFCNRCIHKLPTKLRVAVSQKLGEGFEEAYDDAVQWFECEKGLEGEVVHVHKNPGGVKNE